MQLHPPGGELGRSGAPWPPLEVMGSRWVWRYLGVEPTGCRVTAAMPGRTEKVESQVSRFSSQVGQSVIPWEHCRRSRDCSRGSLLSLRFPSCQARG